MSNPLRTAVKAGETVLGAVDQAVAQRWEPAKRAAAATAGPHHERIAALEKALTRELTAVGAAAGAAAAVPGAGTALVLGSGAAELGWVTLRAADQVLRIAAVHGWTDASVEERRSWVLSVLAFGGSAAAGLRSLAGAMGRGGGATGPARLPVDVLGRVNRALAKRVVRRYAAKRGAVALGRALPAGIGAAIGGTANYALARTITREADQFFRDLDR